MFTKTAAIVLLGSVFVGGGWLWRFLFSEKSISIKPDLDATSSVVSLAGDDISKPWIEILSPAVSELNPSNDKKIRELKTGDEISSGMVIETSKDGKAIVRFRDTSHIKINPDTRLVFETGSFNRGDRTLKLKINLFFGRVWSRIVALSTPASYWEIETGNIVASVRGTSFGVEYINKKSQIITSEKTVSVQLLDPQNKVPIKEAVFVVSDNKYLEIKDDDVSQIAADIKSIPYGVAAPGRVEEKKTWVKDITPTMMKSDWMKEEIQEDEKFESSREIMEPRFEIQPPPVLKKPSDKRGEIPLNTSEDMIRNENEASVSVPATAIPQTAVSAAKPIKLEIVKMSGNLDAVFEGDKIFFKALLVMDDRSKRDVTSEAEWRVIGSIGNMQLPGVFIAKLGLDVSERGISPGTITAIFKDKSSSEAFLAQSLIFNVEAKINPDDLLQSDG